MRARKLLCLVFSFTFLLAISAKAAAAAQGGAPYGGNITALGVAASNPNVMYAATSVFDVFENGFRGSVFKTTDAGQSWTFAGNGLPDGPMPLGGGAVGLCFSLAVDSTNPDVAYAIVTLETGLAMFKTTDAGQHWSAVGSSPSGYNVLADPKTSGTVYVSGVGVSGAGGFFKSSDGGQSWTFISLGLTYDPSSPPSVGIIAFDPTNPATMYASVDGLGYSNFFKSTDGGQSWILANNGLVTPVGLGGCGLGCAGPVSVGRIAIDPANPATLYVTGGGSVYKSTDGGQSWVLVTPWSYGTPPLGVNPIAIDPSQHTTIYAAGSGFFKSMDGGSTWVAMNSGLTDTRIDALVLNPASSTLYVGTANDGIFTSTDGGQSWLTANTGLAARSVEALAMDPSNPATLYAGSVSSFFKTTDGGATWKTLNAGVNTGQIGVGGFFAITVDPTDSNTVYAGLFGLFGVLKSTDAGQSWLPTNIALSVLSLVVDPLLPSTVYAGGGVGVGKSTDGGQTWTVASPSGPTQQVLSVVVDPRDDAIIYAGSNWPGGLFKSIDGALSWTPVLGASVGSVAAIPNGPNATTLYVGTFGGDVAKSVDSGATWSYVLSGITDASGNPAAVRAVVIDPTTAGTVYAGTFGAGILKTTDGGQTWTPMNAGLPNLRILRIVIDSAQSSTIYVATHGSGVVKSTDGGQSWQGTGVPPNSQPAISVSPPQVSFTLFVGSSSPSLAITVSNTGAAPLLISGISTHSPFSLVGPLPTSIPGNGQAIFGISLSATTVGSFTDTITITSNASVSPTTIPLQGTVVALPATNSLGSTGAATQGQSSEPVSTGNGNYYYQHTDFVIPGRGIPLVFQRTYNTLDAYSGPLGGNWTHSYNMLLTQPSPTLAVIKWGDGHGEGFAVDGTTWVPQQGVFSSLTQSLNGTFVLTRKDQTQYNFSSAGKLTSIQDRNGNTLVLSYDLSGNLIQVTDAVGRALTFSYDASNRIIRITDPIGRVVSFTYSATDDLASATDPAGGLTTFSYDSNHRVTSLTLPTGQRLLQNTYDAAGRVAAQTNGRGATTTFAYNTPGLAQTTITDARGNRTIHVYDASLRLMAISDAAGGASSYAYDANNDRTAVTNSNGEATHFAYDSRGNITGITDPLGNSISFTYDLANDLLSITNAKGNTTVFTYDSKENLTGIHDALGNTTSFAYDSYGELTSKTDARGNTTLFAYSAGNLKQITDALGKNTALNYDNIGRLTSITDPNGHSAAATYDALSRLARITDPLGNQTRFSYDGVGNLLTITDANGHSTAYSYDAAYNLTGVADALGRFTQYGYDGNNNRVSFTNAKGKLTSYVYDASNRLIRVTDPLSFATTYSYDPAGNVVSIRDANGTTNQFAYDALNRLIGISYGDGKTVSYTYDANGNRTNMVDSHGTTAYVYDALDRLTTVNHPGGKVVVYGYDAVGNRASVTYPDSKLVTYAYDPVNRLSQVMDWVSRRTTYSYDGASNLIGMLYPNGASVGFTYDAANRLTRVANTYQGSTGNPVSLFSYLLDPVGNRLQVTDGSGKATTYGYDALNQLKSVTVGTNVTNFAYDPVGNRLTLVAPGTSINYSYDAADRLLSAGNTTFAYDNNGNQITKTPPNNKPISYSYDAANRLIAVTGMKYNSAFAYDGDGNRISQTVGSGTYNYVNDVATALPVVLQESGPDGNITYGYGLGLIEEASPAFNFFYQYDGLGSVVGLTDVGSKLDGRYSYDAWGQTDTSIPDTQIGTENKFRFTGEALDPGTGLYYLRARYYDPSVGRFISRDPYDGWAYLPTTLNKYPYAHNIPTAYVDPSGKFPAIILLFALNAAYYCTLYCQDIWDFIDNLKDVPEAFRQLIPSRNITIINQGPVTTVTDESQPGTVSTDKKPLFSLVPSTSSAATNNASIPK
jgi:RHS repeat-associated protein